MGKNQSASGLTNIIQYDSQGNITFVSGSNTLLSISSSGAITTTGPISGSNSVSGSQSITGSLNVTGNITGSNILTSGTVTAQTLVVQTITSSVTYSSGSNIFGNSLTNVQQMTGSLRVTGSFVQSGANTTSSFAGPVGIGFTAPLVALQVSGTIAVGSDTTGWGRLSFDPTSNVTKIQSSKNGTDSIGLSFWTQASGGGFAERMAISGSNVGIGTSSPDYPLTVKTDASANSIKILGRSSGDTSISWNSSDNATQYAHFDIGASYAQLYTSASIPSLQVFAGGNQATAGAYNTFGNLYVASTGSQGTDQGGCISIGGKYNGTSYASFARIQGKKENSSSGQTGGYLAFEVATDATNLLTERMRILSNGTVFFGTSSDIAASYIGIKQSTATYNLLTIQDTNSTYSAANYYLLFINLSGGVAGGIGHPTSTTVNFYTGPSDQRLKSNIQDWNQPVLPLFADAKPKTYNHIADEDESVVYKGFLAQDMVDKFPEAYGQDKEGYYTFNPSGYVPYLVKAIQELKAENDTLKERLTALENK
jgi:Chaperone of endosialidase